MAKDLTNGKVMSQIIAFSIPIFFGNVLQQIYNMADSIIVGQFVGKDAFAAVGSTGSLSFLIIGFVLGLCNGLCIPIAQRYGAGDIADMRKRIVAAVYVSIILGVVLTIAMVFLTDDLLILMKTPDNIYKNAYLYIFIIFMGIPATLLYNLPANILRAIGDSKTPLYFLILSAALNVVLDLVFVCGFYMGVAGTAIATVIAQAFSGILCILYMKKKYANIMTFKKEDYIWNLPYANKAAGIGVPMGLQYSITAIGSVVLSAAVNSLGSETVAAVNAAMKTSMIVVQPLESLGLTIATFAGQNYGAGKYKRIREGVKAALILSVICSAVAFLIVNPMAEPSALLFMKRAEMTDYIVGSMKQMLFYNSLSYILLGSLLIYRYTLQGLGYSVIAMGSGLFEMIARSIIAFLAISTFGFTAICYANPAAWLAANAILIPVYIVVMRKVRRMETTVRIAES